MTDVARHELETICDVIQKTLDIERIYLFGSYAYGVPQADSDYDIYVVIPDDGPRPITAMGNIRKALLPIQARPLDVLVGYSSVFEKRTHWPSSLEREIAKKGVLLYGRNYSEQQRMA
ncbi:nucleotidyltransferase domain-containing protein [Oscillospiraceae bacterium 42-9]|uniref:nucleotidyltransferase domain-containing protein n=1 Tax=Acutalibacter muris TaxID=1796620 RepID=UPI002729EE51|nr:nucleotidyltransferase domain-containing protein [Acutalibacter muris]